MSGKPKTVTSASSPGPMRRRAAFVDPAPEDCSPSDAACGGCAVAGLDLDCADVAGCCAKALAPYDSRPILATKQTERNTRDAIFITLTWASLPPLAETCRDAS